MQGPHLIIHHDDKVLDGMNEWCIDHHGKVSIYIYIGIRVDVFHSMESSCSKRHSFICLFCIKGASLKSVAFSSYMTKILPSVFNFTD